MKRLVLMLLALVASASAQTIVVGQGVLSPTTVANLPVLAFDGTIAAVTDGSGATPCTVGGGVIRALCQFDSNVGSWDQIGATGGGGGDAVQVEDGDDLGTFTPIDTTAIFDDGADINFIFTDGGAGGPDTITAGFSASSTSIVFCDTSPELTIDAPGEITIPGSGCFKVDTRLDTSSDILDTINCATGARFILMAADGARTVIIEDGTPIDIPADFQLDNAKDSWAGLCFSTNVAIELDRTNAGP